MHRLQLNVAPRDLSCRKLNVRQIIMGKYHPFTELQCCCLACLFLERYECCLVLLLCMAAVWLLYTMSNDEKQWMLLPTQTCLTEDTDENSSKQKTSGCQLYAANQ